MTGILIATGVLAGTVLVAIGGTLAVHRAVDYFDGTTSTDTTVRDLIVNVRSLRQNKPAQAFRKRRRNPGVEDARQAYARDHQREAVTT